MKKYLYLSLFLIAIFSIFWYFTGDFLVFINSHYITKYITPKLNHRALIIVAEDNFFVSEQDLYDKTMPYSEMLLAKVFQVPSYLLQNKTLAKIIDEYGEDFLINELKKETSAYTKVITLTDQKASVDNFIQTIIDLNKQGYIVDITLNLHGAKDGICFWLKDYYGYCMSEYELENTVNRLKLKNSVDKLNIGYVYQVVCDGQYTMNYWIKIGAQAANGSVGLNTLTLASPRKFLQNIISGKSYRQSVEDAYNFEYNLYLRFFKLNKGIQKLFSYVDFENSIQKISGNGNYLIR